MIYKSDIKEGMWFTLPSFKNKDKFYCMLSYKDNIAIDVPFEKAIFYIEKVMSNGLICHEFTHIRDGYDYPTVFVSFTNICKDGVVLDIDKEDEKKLLEIIKNYDDGKYDNKEDDTPICKDYDKSKIVEDYDKVFTKDFKIKYNLVPWMIKSEPEEDIVVGREYLMRFDRNEGSAYCYGKPNVCAIWVNKPSTPIMVVTSVDDDNVTFKVAGVDDINCDCSWRRSKKDFLKLTSLFNDNLYKLQKENDEKQKESDDLAFRNLNFGLSKEQAEKLGEDIHKQMQDPAKRKDFKEWLKLAEKGMNYAPAHFKKITDKMNDTFNAKNHDYGNSFRDLFKECGMTYAYGHMAEKLARIKSLMNDDAKVKGESMLDSLYDLANYAVLTIMEVEKLNIAYEEKE